MNGTREILFARGAVLPQRPLVSVLAFLLLIVVPVSGADFLLLPMDRLQTDHCRAYGVVYQTLMKNLPDVAWLLNYRGGSFLLPANPDVKGFCEKMGVVSEDLSKADWEKILNVISEDNMDVVPLEVAPRIVIYLPSAEQDDVVAQTLRYSNIPFKTVYDGEILDGKLADYDWLHIHHKDFTGQGHKRSIDDSDAALASSRGYPKLWQMKQDVSSRIHEFVEGGGFLFAMCSAAETIDVALAAKGVDIVERRFDGDPPEDGFQAKLDFKRCFAFTDFTVMSSPVFHYSDIDVPSAGADTTFSLFEFSAQVDPVPCLLNQDHEREIEGFSGETTSFRQMLVRKDVTILARNNDGVSVRYLMGNVGKGFFSFYGGHAPGENHYENFRRYATGFRLILNNVLFPSAKTKKRKT